MKFGKPKSGGDDMSPSLDPVAVAKSVLRATSQSWGTKFPDPEEERVAQKRVEELVSEMARKSPVSTRLLGRMNGRYISPLHRACFARLEAMARGRYGRTRDASWRQLAIRLRFPAQGCHYTTK